jgi:hypothetical protein
LVRPAYNKVWFKLGFFCQVLFWYQCPVVLLALGGRWLSPSETRGISTQGLFPSHLQWSLSSFCEHGLLLAQFIKNRANKTLLAWVHALVLWLWARQKMRISVSPHGGHFVSRTWLPSSQKLGISYLWLASRLFLIFFSSFFFVFFVQQQVLSFWNVGFLIQRIQKASYPGWQTCH